MSRTAIPRRWGGLAALTLLTAAVGAACQTSGGGSAGAVSAPASEAPPGAPSASLEDTTWELVRLGGAPLPEGIKRPPNLRLDAGEKRLVGFGGCNRVFGGYTVEGASLKISPLGTTKMGCLGPQMPLEKRFLDALERVAAYTISGNILTLRAGQEEIATLHAAAPPP
jgi:heat shock protein HslJ